MPTVGIIADTPIPWRLPRLPGGVRAAFPGVDLILHAGDLTRLQVLEVIEL